MNCQIKVSTLRSCQLAQNTTNCLIVCKYNETRAFRVCTPVNGYPFRKLSFIKDCGLRTEDYELKIKN